MDFHTFTEVDGVTSLTLCRSSLSGQPSFTGPEKWGHRLGDAPDGWGVRLNQLVSSTWTLQTS
ncbi:hypothetical protein GCM10027580_20030 [Corynebacterium faecale]